MNKAFINRSRASAFTAIDLVVLITVVVGALSILLPLTYNGIAQAKVNSCARNQGQIGKWIYEYCKTTDGLLPAYEEGWIQLIAAMGDLEVDQSEKPKGAFSCPSQGFKSFIKGVSPADYWRGSYFGMNQHLSSNLKNEFEESYPFWTQLNIKTIKNSAAKVLLADASGSNYFQVPGRDPVVAGMSLDGVNYTDSLHSDPAIPFPFLRHLNGAGNFLFLDGHVELKRSWPVFMRGRGTSGYYFWSGENIKD